MFSFHPLNRLKFFIERQFVKGAHYQFLAMALVVGLISVLGGALVLGTEAGEDLGETIWWAFLRLSDPGYLGDDVGVRQRLVATILTLSGYVVVLGTVVAILTRWLISFMRELERGLTPVVMRDHLIVLGWTDRTIPILRDILSSTAKVRRFLASRGQKKRVRMAILANDITPEMTDNLRMDTAIDARFGDVVLRSGSTLDVRHLERVASLHAASIIVPTQVFDADNRITSDIETIKTLLSLEGLARPSQDRKPYVVAEIQDPRKLAIIRRAYSGPLEVIAGDSVISELMVQTIHSPGLSRVYNELLDPNLGNEIVIYPVPELSGQRFDEATRRFDETILCGVIRKENQRLHAHLNPSGDFALRDDDEMIFIASPDATFTPGDQPDRDAQPLAPARDSAPAPIRPLTPRKLLILGWSQKVITMLNELSSYTGETVEVTVLSTFSAAKREEEIDYHCGALPKVTCRNVNGDYTVARDLAAVKPTEFDSIILISSDRVAAGEEADARTIGGYLCLQEVLDELVSRPHLVVELADAHNRELLGEEVDEVLISPLLISHILAQVAMHRGFRPVLVELFTASGAECIFRQPADYELSGETITIRELRQRARQFGEILLGINDELNPGIDDRYTLGDSDRIIALTTLEDDAS